MNQVEERVLQMEWTYSALVHPMDWLLRETYLTLYFVYIYLRWIQGHDVQVWAFLAFSWNTNRIFFWFLKEREMVLINWKKDVNTVYCSSISSDLACLQMEQTGQRLFTCCCFISYLHIPTIPMHLAVFIHRVFPEKTKRQRNCPHNLPFSFHAWEVSVTERHQIRLVQ